MACDHDGYALAVSHPGNVRAYVDPQALRGQPACLLCCLLRTLPATACLLCCLLCTLPANECLLRCLVQEYMDFEGGSQAAANARGLKPETQEAIRRWLKENSD